MDGYKEFIARIGDFFMVVGTFLFVLFVSSDLADSPDFDFLFLSKPDRIGPTRWPTFFPKITVPRSHLCDLLHKKIDSCFCFMQMTVCFQ